MKISIIVAAAQNNAIGINNTLPWHLSADLKYFKKLTTGNTIIMGRKTYDSIGKALPNRTNIVITRNKNFEAENVIVSNSLDDAIKYCKNKKLENIFIIGGDSIYKQSMGIVEKIYLTRVHTSIENADAFFPELDNSWQISNVETYKADEKNDWDYSFEVWEKK